MIRAEGISKFYRGANTETPALECVNLEIGRGEMVAITGHSGSGKTTLLNIIGGLDRAYEGRLLLDGRNLADLGDREMSSLRNRTLGFVFQAFHLLPHLTVLENVTLPSSFGASEDPGSASRRATEALERVGLEDKVRVRPTMLSAGERQRVAIARAVLNRPALLLCDEPTGNLDEDTGRRVLDIFTELNREDGTTLLMATHSKDVANVTGRRIVLERGRLKGDQE